MRLRILDLDGSLLSQPALRQRYDASLASLADWGPDIRLGCGFAEFRWFERELAQKLGSRHDAEPWLTLYGSGDFHHVSLALLRRLETPFNLVVFDHHPDWMRGVPILHCGTWLYHAAHLPQIRQIIHIGGDVDFDNAYRWLAPWPLLEAGKIRVFPAMRCYRAGRWRGIPHTPVRTDRHVPIELERWEELLEPLHADLRRWPLYISLDKDVLNANEAPVNWDSGCLTLEEVRAGVQTLIGAAEGRLAGMDILGDWSPVRVRGVLRHLLHWTEHTGQDIDPRWAAPRNEATNVALLEAVLEPAAQARV